MVTALDMAPMLKARRRKKGEKGETALTLPFPFYQEVEVFPEPLKRLPCRSNWPMYKKNSLVCFSYTVTLLHFTAAYQMPWGSLYTSNNSPTLAKGLPFNSIPPPSM